MITTIKSKRLIEEEHTITVCDFCNKSLQPEDGNKYASYTPLPIGTYMIRYSSGDYGTYTDKDKEFCSKVCLIEWCLKEKNAE